MQGQVEMEQVAGLLIHQVGKSLTVGFTQVIDLLPSENFNVAA